MRTLLFLLAMACDTTPTHVSTGEVDEAIARQKWNVVCRGLQMKEDRTREYATERITKTAPDEEAKACICENIQGKSGWDPSIASGLIGQTKDAAVSCFADLVAKPDLPKREEAVVALGLTAAPIAMKTLAQISQEEGAPAAVRAKAIAALKGHKDYEGTMLSLLTDDAEPEVRAAAADALSGMTASNIVKALVQAAKTDKEGTVRGAALIAAKASRAPAADTMVCEAMMSDPSPAVRSAAIRALRGTRRDSSADCLRKRALTYEADASVRDELLSVLKSSPNDKAALILCDAIPFWMKSYVIEEIPDKLPGTEIVKAQNDRDHERSYACLQKAWKKSSGYSCFAKLHVGVWFREVGAKGVRVPACPGYEAKD